ncbi:DUF494 family protein, partial [Escherichia coli]|nr:DUF494 family protein [Escherichia coli]
ALDTAEFDLEDLKWVILMVLFNIPGSDHRSEMFCHNGSGAEPDGPSGIGGM